uniref:FIIND domain-containing protein n=1 Tax=Electrophorus electricus TaxID=8005 RepID=A0A4W4GVP7_ELEEL
KSLLMSVFIPEMGENHSEDRNSNTYRFLCPYTGQFQCKITNIVFDMKEKGEMLYRIVSWDTHLLDGLGHMQPAGPLYNIDCFEGSVSHLHLPHCEVISEEHQVELAVARFTGENLEVIKPLRVTDTHVIVAIHGLSLFGLIRKIFPARSMSAQVLLFYKPITGMQNLKQLHIHLLPRVVPVKEVQDQHMDFKHITTSSTCQLTPGRKYRPSCDHYVPQPKVTIFDCDYGPNYHPTFEVFLEADHVTVKLLDENEEEVWETHRLYLTEDKCTSLFFHLIQRVSSVMEIADCLKSKNMITDEMYSNIQAASTSHQRMRFLYDALQTTGKAGKAELYEILKEKMPHLVEDLESGPSQCFRMPRST